MKGLQTGIPLAVLAAVARAHYPGGETAIDGNHGTDVGGSVGFDFNQAHNTAVDNKEKDDHSFTANHKGELGPHAGWPLRRKARDWPGGKTGIDGNHGVDVGNDFSSSNDQSHNTGISNDETDDHSYTENHKGKWGFKRSVPETAIDGNAETDVGNSVSKSSKKPEWAKWVQEDDGRTAIDGAHGTDVGGSVETGGNQQHNTAIKNKVDDDHSVTGNGKHEGGVWFRKRQTAIEGNGETDIGNIKEAGGDQSVETDIKNKSTDDHSKTVNHKGHKKGCCRNKRSGPETGIDGSHGVDVGNDFGSSNDQAVNTGISNDLTDDHSVTGNHKAHVNPWGFKRQGRTAIDGNGETDVGNSAGLGGDQSHNTGIKNDVTDDHSYTENHKGKWFKRWGPETAIDGNHGVDVGNGFSSSNDQQHNTAVDNKGKDDHSVTANHKDTGVFPWFKRSGPLTGIGANHGVDVGNDAAFSYDQEMNTDILNDLADDHSTTENSKGSYGVPFLRVRSVKRDPFPEVPEGPVGIGANHGKDIGNKVSGGSDQHVKTTVENDFEDDHSVTINRDDHKRAYRPESPEPAPPTEPAVPAEPVEASPMSSHAANAGDAACATETRQVVHTVTQTVYTEPSSAPAVSSPAVASSSAVASPSSEVVEHLIMTSTLMVPESSSFHQIPVYVPEPSSSAAASSHIVNSPASSSVSIPTSVDAYRPGAPTSPAVASPSSHSGVSFQGAGVQLAPSAGIMSAVAGVVALLAFVL